MKPVSSVRVKGKRPKTDIKCLLLLRTRTAESQTKTSLVCMKDMIMNYEPNISLGLNMIVTQKETSERLITVALMVDSLNSCSCHVLVEEQGLVRVLSGEGVPF